MEPWLVINAQVKIDSQEFEFSFVRSSGPGGQNVNKVSSKAVLRWSVLESRSLNAEVKAILLGKLAPRLNSLGELIITSDEYRDQPRNREACVEKLKAQVAQALFVPKKRKKTKASFSTRKKNETSKKKHSEKKRLRGRF